MDSTHFPHMSLPLVGMKWPFPERWLLRNKQQCRFLDITVVCLGEQELSADISAVAEQLKCW